MASSCLGDRKQVQDARFDSHLTGVKKESFYWRTKTLAHNQGGGQDSNSARYLFRVPIIHRCMTSHPVAELLLCFRAKHQDGRPMPFGFLVVLTHRLTELCILNA